jgi:hypothetical protein
MERKEELSSGEMSRGYLYFIFALIVDNLLIYTIGISNSKAMDLFLFALVFVLSIAILMIRCNICSTLVYRYDSDVHGPFNLRSLWPRRNCPVCNHPRFHSSHKG